MKAIYSFIFLINLSISSLAMDAASVATVKSRALPFGSIVEDEATGTKFFLQCARYVQGQCTKVRRIDVDLETQVSGPFVDQLGMSSAE